jgi:PAS domain S-box-containing protein
MPKKEGYHSVSDTEHTDVSGRSPRSGDQNDQGNNPGSFSARDLGLDALAEIVESSLDAITVANQEARHVYANPAACELLGYSAQDLIGRSTIFHSKGQERERMEKLFKEGWSGRGSSTIVRPNGEERDIEFSAVWIEAEGQTYTVGITRDVTEVRRLEREGQALMQIASSVAFGGSLKSTLDNICRHVVRATGAEAAAVVLNDPETQKFTIVGMHGLSEEFVATQNTLVASGTRLPLLETIEAGQVLRAADIRRTVLGVPELGPLHDYMRVVTWDTVIIAPLVSRNNVVGALIGYYPPSQQIGEAEQSFHTAIANQAAVAVENARLLAQVHDKAASEERQHLARELHDSVSQALFSINLTARSIEILLRRETTQSDAVLKILADLRQLTQGAQAEMRALIFELRPGALEEEGLLQALRKHAAAVSGRDLLQVEVLYPDEGHLPRLKPAAEEAVYRIAQEALHNVVKHAKASQVLVRLTTEGENFTLTVRDNGVGFDRSKVPAGHLGLGTMGQRAAALGGEYAVESTPGAGTTVTVRLPLTDWQVPEPKVGPQNV